MTIKKPRSGNALFVVIVSENKEDNKAPCSGCALRAGERGKRPQGVVVAAEGGATLAGWALIGGCTFF